MCQELCIGYLIKFPQQACDLGSHFFPVIKMRKIKLTLPPQLLKDVY